MRQCLLTFTVLVLLALQELEGFFAHPVPQVLQHEVHDLVVVALLGQVVANSGEGLVEDGQEHVEKDEDDEQHVEEEVGGAQDAVGFLQHLELGLACG